VKHIEAGALAHVPVQQKQIRLHLLKLCRSHARIGNGDANRISRPAQNLAQGFHVMLIIIHDKDACVPRDVSDWINIHKILPD